MSFWLYNIYDGMRFLRDAEANKRRDNFIKYKMSRKRNHKQKGNKRGK